MLYQKVTPLEMLKSADPKQRCQACKKLRSASCLSMEDIQALRKATGDLYPEVAAAARKALDAHGQSYSAFDLDPFSTREIDQGQVETKSISWRDSTLKRKALVILGGLVGLVVYILFISEGGRTAEAICTRVEPSGPVDCVREISMFWIIPLDKMEIRNVKSVLWEETKWYDSEGSLLYAYSIELATDQGQYPFSPYYSPGGPKLEALESLQSFVYSTAPGTLVVTDPGALTWETLEYHGLLIGLYAILYLYVSIISAREKRKAPLHQAQT
jgi:hypothetical protein